LGDKLKLNALLCVGGFGDKLEHNALLYLTENLRLLAKTASLLILSEYKQDKMDEEQETNETVS
jgi:hypothetical protein